MTQKQVVENISTREFADWLAYYSLQDEEYEERIQKEIEKQKSAEEQAEAFKRMFGFYNNKNKKNK